ncbi:hypothetical protein F511_13522 [Dorcoceras hygrometricum]|uniref:Uncharacterized protein n=1 Tax=Dorcoceras hygrometricum TaxID=472368 RepID=A0A2Z7BB89_9LAMI|nr:hypothetical protein F511_13522 [Dorcoceras hygrometricum]
MELPQETEDYIRESIDHSVGLPVSSNTMLDKIRAVEAANLCLRQQYLCLQSKMREKDEIIQRKDEIIERARAEASMNAIALKRFVDENQKLAVECANLLEQSNKWERECSLYEQDREALMDFANEADEKGKEAESRNQELVEQNKKLLEELQLFRLQSEAHKDDVPDNDLHMEQVLLDSLLAVGKENLESTALGFLEENSGIEVCAKILKMWSSFRPVTQKIVAMVAEMRNLEKDKDHLKVNLHRAEEEVNVLFEECNKLNEANKKLIRQLNREMHISASDGKCMSSTSGKGKRKCSPKTSSPLERKLDFSDADSQRQPLSPLQSNSPESRTRKK